MALVKLLVYGTLKNLNKNIEARFLGNYKTKDKYVMFDSGVDYPLLIDKNYGFKNFDLHSDQIICEMYEIDDRYLYKLDHFEGHPHFFIRKNILNEQNEECFIYLFIYKDKKFNLNKLNIIKEW